MADTLEHRLDEALAGDPAAAPADAFIAGVRRRRTIRRTRAVGGLGTLAVVAIVVVAAWPSRPADPSEPVRPVPIVRTDPDAPPTLAELNALNRGDGPLVLPTGRPAQRDEPLRVDSWLRDGGPGAILDSL